jgi:hypothetical protein
LSFVSHDQYPYHYYRANWPDVFVDTALNATCYIHQLRSEKRVAHGSRSQPTDSVSKLLSPLSRRIDTNPSESGIQLVTQPPTPRKSMLVPNPVFLSNVSFSSSFEFDPYKEHAPPGGASIVSLGPDPGQLYGRPRQTREEIIDIDKRRVNDSEAVHENSPAVNSSAASNIPSSLPPTSVAGSEPSMVMVGTASPQQASLTRQDFSVKHLPPLPMSSEDTQIQIPLRPVSEIEITPIAHASGGPTSSHPSLAKERDVSRPASTLGGGISQPHDAPSSLQQSLSDSRS